jgi:ubiquinone/menaquinone biosynthesis C-methylase UbiE
VSLNTDVRAYWEQEPCGTDKAVVGDRPALTKEWFEEVERFRYQVEPFIHSVAQFTRHRGKRILEVGVGAGTDHLQWARAGCDCYGVDLTDAAIETTRARFALYGLESKLQRMDAERLPFSDGFFDLVYSWGVIHHSEHPDRIIAEIHRVLRPGGTFIGMLYGRRSVTVLHVWLRHALRAGRPRRSFAEVVWHHVESLGTKAYTERELRQLFGAFQTVQTTPILTVNDRAGFPRWVSQFLPARWGWFIAVHAMKADKAPPNA